MSMTFDDHLDALFQEGKRMRDRWWAGFVATLNSQARMAGSVNRYIAETERMVPDPQPHSQPVPHPHQPVEQHHDPLPPLGGGLPPPVPNGYPSGATMEELLDSVDAYEQQMRARGRG